MSLVNSLQFEINSLRKSKSLGEKEYTSKDIKRDLELFKEKKKIECEYDLMVLEKDLEMYNSKKEIDYTYDKMLLEREYELKRDLALYQHNLDSK